MLNSSNMDCSNMGLLDNNFIEQNYSYSNGRRRNRGRGRGNENYSNAVSQETIQAGTQATTAVVSALASRQPNAGKQAARAQKKEFKSVCGRKPLSKKKQGAWQDCVNKYTATKSPAASTSIDTNPSPAADYGSSRTSSGNDGSGEKKFYQKPLFIGTAVVVVVLCGFLLYTKVFKKAPIAVPVG
jgi:cytoskeletal protein RodZ